MLAKIKNGNKRLAETSVKFTLCGTRLEEPGICPKKTLEGEW